MADPPFPVLFLGSTVISSLRPLRFRVQGVSVKEIELVYNVSSPRKANFPRKAASK